MRKKDTKERSHRKPSKTWRPDHWAQGTLPLSCLRESLGDLREIRVRSLSLIWEDEAHTEVVYWKCICK